MAKKLTGKQALQEIKTLSGLLKIYYREEDKARYQAGQMHRRLTKAIKNFPPKERELYQEKLDKYLPL